MESHIVLEDVEYNLLGEYNMTQLVKSLECVLADMYALYLKTQNYHWNIEGCCFKELHVMFEDQYNDLFKAIDECAELIRGLDCKVVGTFEEFSKKTSIKPGNEKASSDIMVKDLFSDQSVIEKSLKTVLQEATKIGDEVVAGFIVDRLTAHRKNAWMLKSSQCNK